MDFKKYRKYRGYFFITLAVVVLLFTEYQKQPDGKLHAHFFDVGQGDATLLVSPSGKQVLIDGGPNMDVLEYLGEHMPFFDRTIELLVLTHPDKDHLTTLPEILRRYTVDHILMTGIAAESSWYHDLLSEIDRQNIDVILADPENDIDLGDGITLDVLWPPPGLVGKTVGSKNDTSVVFKVEGAEKSILLTGDIEKEVEAEILRLQHNIRADILKVAHHGSRTSSTNAFLRAVQADTAIISAGADNRYNHPHSDVIDRLHSAGMDVWNTGKNGNFSISLDIAK